MCVGVLFLHVRTKVACYFVGQVNFPLFFSIINGSNISFSCIICSNPLRPIPVSRLKRFPPSSVILRPARNTHRTHTHTHKMPIQMCYINYVRREKICNTCFFFSPPKIIVFIQYNGVIRSGRWKQLAALISLGRVDRFGWIVRVSSGDGRLCCCGWGCGTFER